MENFNLKKFLVENKLTTNSKTLEEIKKLNPESLTVHTLAVKRASKLKEDIENDGYEPEIIKKHLSKDGSLVGYLFQCTTCGQHRLHVDCD